MICHHHRCLFVHIPKNAGQSVEQVFVKLLGLSWETRAPLLLRHNDRPELGPPKLAHLKWWEYVEHKYLTQAQFDEYFKFAVVRNPWARIVSMYKYFGFHHRIGFSDFVVKEFRSRIWSEFQWFVGPQSDFICDNDGRLMVDFVGRVEELQSDFNQVCLRIGLPPTEVPHIHASHKETANASSSKSALSWFQRRRVSTPSFATFQEYYNRDTRDIVAKLYERDIRLFGYEFDGFDDRLVSLGANEGRTETTGSRLPGDKV